MTIRSIKHHANYSKKQMSEGFQAVGLRNLDKLIDPFLMIDHFWMAQPTFPPHPHAGFSAVTVMLEDSEGSFINRDSKGNKLLIIPGAIHWTRAGKGIIHEEVPEIAGVTSHGLQIFVNLAAENELVNPEALHLEPDEVPVLENTPNAKLRVLAGSINGVSSSLKLLTEVTMVDAKLEPNASVSIPFTDETAFAIVLNGSGIINETEVKPYDVVVFNQDGDSLEFTANAEGLHLLVGGGKPLHEPINWRGSLEMSSVERLNQAQRDYVSGKMGTLV